MKNKNFDRENIGNVFIESLNGKTSFSLPKNVDIENVDADYTSGVLSISIPKFEERKPKTKKITVK